MMGLANRVGYAPANSRAVTNRRGQKVVNSSGHEGSPTVHEFSLDDPFEFFDFRLGETPGRTPKRIASVVE